MLFAFYSFISYLTGYILVKNALFSFVKMVMIFAVTLTQSSCSWYFLNGRWDNLSWVVLHDLFSMVSWDVKHTWSMKKSFDFLSSSTLGLPEVLKCFHLLTYMDIFQPRANHKIKRSDFSRVIRDGFMNHGVCLLWTMHERMQRKLPQCIIQKKTLLIWIFTEFKHIFY